MLRAVMTPHRPSCTEILPHPHPPCTVARGPSASMPGGFPPCPNPHATTTGSERFSIGTGDALLTPPLHYPDRDIGSEMLRATFQTGAVEYQEKVPEGERPELWTA